MNKLAVDLVCDIYSPSGYSSHAREVIRALHPLCDLRIIDHKHDRMSVDLDRTESELFRSLQDNDRKPDVRIQFETPEFFEPVSGIKNIGFTQWETTRIPDTDYKGSPRNNWVKQMNRMDGMLTSCKFAARAFEDSGVTVPIEVFYGPVNTTMHKPDLPELPIDSVVVDSSGVPIPRSKRPLVVGMVAQWTLRKNIESFLITMAARFKAGEIHIILKTYGSSMDPGQNLMIEKRIKDITDWVKNEHGPRISLITEKLNDQEMAQLYSSMDVYVSTSRGEGFCMPVVQAMACGAIPVVCGFSAPGEYVGLNNGFKLPYQLSPAVGMTWSPWYRADQDWADVDCKALEFAIRDIRQLRLQNPERYLELKSAARATVVQEMSHKVAGQNMLAAIQKIIG